MPTVNSYCLTLFKKIGGNDVILSGGIDDKISQNFFSGRYSVKIIIYTRVEYMFYLGLLFRHRLRLRTASICLLLLLFTAGLIRGAYAQGQTCRDVNQLTICGDTLTEFAADFNSGGFRLRGNVKIGPKGSPAVVQVRDTGSVLDGSVMD